MSAWLTMCCLTGVSFVLAAAQWSLKAICWIPAKMHNRIEAMHPAIKVRFDAAEARFQRWQRTQ
jgi:hypothetical protein